MINKACIDEAENLFVYKQNTLEEIASKLGISSKSVSRWKARYSWDKKRADFLKSKQCFHEELYELARKLMKDIESDIDAGEKIDPGRMYSLCRILPMFLKVKDYEEVTSKAHKKETPKGLTPDMIAQIEEDVLGIKRQEQPEADIQTNETDTDNDE